MPALSAIVPATDRPQTLAACRRALDAAAEPPEEVLVVDQPHGAGPAAARNAGAARAGGEVLVFVDSDVEVHGDAVVRIRRAFAGDSELTALFGSYDDTPRARGTVSQFRNLLHHHVHHASAGPASTFWAGLGAIRRDAFLAAGGFDVARFPTSSIEDIELGMRLTAAGARIELDPAVQGTHLKAWTLTSMVRTDLLSRGAPWVVELLRFGTSSGALNLGWRHRLSALSSVAAAVSLLRVRPGGVLAALAALVALNRGFYALLAKRGGWRLAATGVLLHAVHHLTSTAAIPVGAVAHIRQRRAAPAPPRPAPADAVPRPA